MTLSDSDKRALRTAFHAVIGLIGAVPTIVVLVHNAHLDSSQQVQAGMATMVLWTGLAAKGINWLEDHGWMPAFLKAGPIVLPPEPSDGTVPVAPITDLEEAAKIGGPAGLTAEVTDPEPPAAA
jgi:hypothetical protein